MKRWQVILGTMLALVVTVLVPLTAMAQSGDSAAPAAKQPFKGALAIVAPRGVQAGKEMSLGVFLRENQEPVQSAGVWALTRDNAEALKKEADTLREKVANAEDADYEAILGARGSFLGRTREDGRLLHTFNDTGEYVLIAAKKGFAPDVSPLAVREIKAGALVVTAPRVSPPGESVTIGVTDKGTGEAVKEAGVWALTRDNAESLKTQVAETRVAGNATIDIESLLNGRGVFLGTTNGNGELKYTFEQEGIYVLVAFKKGFMPGFTGIAIKNAPKALTVEAPKISPVGESVKVRVGEKATGDAVKDAGVWALTPAEAETLKSKMAALKPAANATGDIDIEAVVGGFGTFLGRTNGDGDVKHTFDAAGRYVLVAAKKGYIPGYTGIAIVVPKPATTSNATSKPTVSPKAIERPKPGNAAGTNSTNVRPVKETLKF